MAHRSRDHAARNVGNSAAVSIRALKVVCFRSDTSPLNQWGTNHQRAEVRIGSSPPASIVTRCVGLTLKLLGGSWVPSSTRNGPCRKPRRILTSSAHDNCAVNLPHILEGLHGYSEAESPSARSAHPMTAYDARESRPLTGADKALK